MSEDERRRIDRYSQYLRDEPIDKKFVEEFVKHDEVVTGAVWNRNRRETKGREQIDKYG